MTGTTEVRWAYEISAGRMFIVTFENGNVYVTPPGGSRQQLFLQSGPTYRMGDPRSTTTVTFMEEDGVVMGFTARQNGVDVS